LHATAASFVSSPDHAGIVAPEISGELLALVTRIFAARHSLVPNS
jgi:hypothetical protein